MTSAALLSHDAPRGVTIQPRGDRLHIEASLGTLTDADRAAIRQHKLALLAALRRRQARPIVLPTEVHEVPLDAIKALGGADWPALATDQALLECFTRSALLHGTLTRSADPEPDDWALWEQVVPITPKGRWDSPLEAKPGKAGKGRGKP